MKLRATIYNGNPPGTPHQQAYHVSLEGAEDYVRAHLQASPDKTVAEIVEIREVPLFSFKKIKGEIETRRRVEAPKTEETPKPAEDPSVIPPPETGENPVTG